MFIVEVYNEDGELERIEILFDDTEEFIAQCAEVAGR
jgi:hypothetical protein